MTDRRRIIPTILAAALVALCLPILASAQGSYDPWNRNRDYGRDRDYRRDRRDNGDYGRYGYNNRGLRDSIRRVKDRSDDFRDHLDSALDHSRYDDTRREDRINDVAREFEQAANRLEDRFDDGRDLNRSAGEAQRLLQIGSRIDNFMSRNRLDGRVVSDWAQIRQDLRVIASAYGNSGYNGGYYGNDGYYGRNDGYYGNDDDYRRREEQRRREEERRRRQQQNRSRIGDILRRFPY
ncbi:MAG TPA: hypothetical protein VE842_00600 [Pyrinomonadaceae bacterium]|jgi:hypothetical protein|nr:hypothetical protein [Pyrinomonadaceae bacterium]